MKQGLPAWLLLAGMALSAATLVLNNRPASAQEPSPAPGVTPAPPAAPPAAEPPAPPPKPEGAAATTAPVAPEAPLPSKPSEVIPVGVAVDFPSDI